jgi:TatD DNase family protein
MLIDTHAHLDWTDFRADIAGTIDRARKAGVDAIVTIGSDPDSWLDSLDIVTKFPGVYCGLGVHPHDASKLQDTTLGNLAVLCKRRGVVAIGEIGLDYHYDRAPRDVQREAFSRQLDLARQLNMPAIIHSRDADDDTLSILRSDGAGIRGAMHCFSGDVKMAMDCIVLGYYISVAGPVTYPKAAMRQEVAALVPLDRIVIETDSPFLAPQPKRGLRNEPSYLPYVADKIAQIRGRSVEEIGRITTQNARELFRLPGA